MLNLLHISLLTLGHFTRQKTLGRFIMSDTDMASNVLHKNKE
jgi:hypothetical protein